MRLLGVFHCIDIINYHMLPGDEGKGSKPMQLILLMKNERPYLRMCGFENTPHFKVNLNMPLSRRCVRL